MRSSFKSEQHTALLAKSSVCERLQQRLYQSYFRFGKAKERRKPNGFQVSLTQAKRKEGGYKPYEFDSLLLSINGRRFAPLSKRVFALLFMMSGVMSMAEAIVNISTKAIPYGANNNFMRHTDFVFQSESVLF